MRRGILTIVALAASGLVGAALANDGTDRRPAPPATRKVDVVDNIFTITVPDPYRWLENEDDPEVLDWVAKQNAFTDGYFDQITQQSQIESRLHSLFNAARIRDYSVVGDRHFIRRRTALQDHNVLYLRGGRNRDEERAIIDPNTFSSDGTVAMDWMSVSPDGRLIAYGKSSNGDEWSTLYIKNVDTGQHLTDTIPRTRYCQIAWAPDSRSFLYTRYPQPSEVAKGDENYYRRVYRHKLGRDWKNDELILDVAEKAEFVNPVTNVTNEWVFVSRSVDWSKNDLYLRRFDDDGPFKPMIVGEDAHASADLVDGRLIIMTNLDAPRYRIVVADPSSPTPEHWREIIPQQKGVMKSFAIVGRKIVVHLLEDAHSRMLLYDLDGKPEGEITLPTVGTVRSYSGLWDGDELFLTFHSFVYPTTVFRYDLKTRALKSVASSDTGINRDDYETRQVWYKSLDGTRIPMFIVHRKGLKLDGRRPTLLKGYGGFNISITPAYNPAIFAWLERGGVYASANLRGGGEFGSEWHAAGRRDKKQNVFDDFIWAAKALIKLGYTSSEKLAIEGRSNGGLLVGACMTQYPSLFRAVVCQVPLLDMVRYHRFSIARLWIPEYGSAENPVQFKWLIGYSPYHQVMVNTKYPATLLMTAASDSRVNPFHAWKMTAALQANTKGDGPILLRTEFNAGHGAGKPLSRKIKDQAERFTFLMNELGMFDIAQ